MATRKFLHHWSHSDIDIEVTNLYQSPEPWPLADWLERWKAGRIDAPTAVVIKLFALTATSSMRVARVPLTNRAPSTSHTDWLTADNINNLTHDYDDEVTPEQRARLDAEFAHLKMKEWKLRRSVATTTSYGDL